MSIRKGTDISLTGNKSILLKGPFGFGKTIAAISMLVDGPVYLAYFDKPEPVEVVTFLKKIGRQDLLERFSWEGFSSNNANDYLNRLIGFTKDCRYIGIVTDSVTSLTSAAVNWSMGFRAAGGKKDKVSEGPALIPDWDEYKVETSLVTQALDICKTLPCHNIWTAHPVPSIRVEGGGASQRVSKVNNIVSYGSKIGGILPGNFTEIYHFSKQVDYNTQPSTTKYVITTDMIGDDYAKTAFKLPAEIDITDKLFWEVMKPLYEAQ